MNIEAVVFRPANRADAGRIVEIIRAGFTHEFISMTPFGCHGAESYCGELIRERSRGGTSAFAVAELDGELIGCLELRTTIESMHVNYVCTIPSARSLGVAGRLLDDSVIQAQRSHHHWLRLDVLAENTVAHGWYRRRGFEAVSAANWFALPPSDSCLAQGYITSGGQSELLQTAFGFSEVTVLTPTGQYRVGLLGESWIRVIDLRVLSDEHALGLLSNQFPERAILAITDAALPASIAAKARLVAQTARMQVRLSDYLALPSIGSRGEQLA